MFGLDGSSICGGGLCNYVHTWSFASCTDTPGLEAEDHGYSPPAPPSSTGAASTSTLPSINISSPLAQNATLEQRKVYVVVFVLLRSFADKCATEKRKRRIRNEKEIVMTNSVCYLCTLSHIF